MATYDIIKEASIGKGLAGALQVLKEPKMILENEGIPSFTCNVTL